MKALLHNLTIDDLPSKELKEIAKQTSIGFVKELLIKCPGLKVYIPKEMHRSFIDSYIRKNHKTATAKLMAESLGVTTRTIERKIGSLGVRSIKKGRDKNTVKDFKKD